MTVQILVVCQSLNLQELAFLPAVKVFPPNEFALKKDQQTKNQLQVSNWKHT